MPWEKIFFWAWAIAVAIPLFVAAFYILKGLFIIVDFLSTPRQWRPPRRLERWRPYIEEPRPVNFYYQQINQIVVEVKVDEGGKVIDSEVVETRTEERRKIV